MRCRRSDGTRKENLFSFFSSRCFLKEIENMYSVFLSNYTNNTNTRESLGQLEKAEETLACGSCSHSISRSPKLPLVFLRLDRNTVHVFSFWNLPQIVFGLIPMLWHCIFLWDFLLQVNPLTPKWFACNPPLNSWQFLDISERAWALKINHNAQ